MTEVEKETPADMIREQIDLLQAIQDISKVGDYQKQIAVAMAIGTLAEKLAAVEREVKDDASKPD